MFIYLIHSGCLVTASAASSLGQIIADSTSETKQAVAKRIQYQFP